jgi:hypothetical protein
MFRVIFWLLGLVVIISLLRGVIGIILKGLAELMNPNQPRAQERSGLRDLHCRGNFHP